MNLIACITMTSLELVDFINGQRGEGDSELRHDHFMAKVPRVIGEDHAPKFRDMVQVAIGSGATRQSPIYRFPKREACLMAMSYSYELQAKVFDRMTELEQGGAFPIPRTLSGALMLAAQQAERIEQQQALIAQQQPAVEFVGRYVQADGLKGFREVCKLLKANEARFREFVLCRKIMYRLGGTLTAHQQHIDAGRFEVRAGIAEVNEHAYTTTKFTPKGIDWIAGEWARHQLRQDSNVQEAAHA